MKVFQIHPLLAVLEQVRRMRNTRFIAASIGPGWCWLFALAIELTLSQNGFGQDQPSSNPNIILIVADDLGYGDLGCYGQEKISTPNIDRLATEGMRFTDFYAGSTVCAPSRCVLMTGMHAGHCYIRGNGSQYLRPGDVTIAEVLHGAGYACGCFGKWGLGTEKTAGRPTKQGFDEFYGYLDQRHAHNYYPSFLIRDDKHEPLKNVVPNESPEGAGVASERVDYSHDLIFKEAIQFVDNHKLEPFFLYLPVTLPHANNEASKKGMEAPDLGPFANNDWPEPEKGFAAMVRKLDQSVGELTTSLEEFGLTGRTIVLFMSDNGPHKEGGHDPEFFKSSGPFRGHKRDLTEGGIRVPLIARCPGRIEAGSVSHHWCYNGDLFATLCDLAGARTLPGLDSVSIAPTLLGRAKDQDFDRYLYWEFYEGGFTQAVRHGEWKAIRPNGPGGKTELYNLTDDPGEKENLATREPKVTRQMAAFMDEAHVDTADWQIPSAEKPAPKKPPGKKAGSK